MRILTICLLATLLMACNPSPPQPMGTAESGRAETDGIRRAEDMTGNSDPIATKVDGALNANEQRSQSLDQALEAQSSEH